MTNKKGLSDGQMAAIIARGCANKKKEACNLEFALELLQKEKHQLKDKELDHAKVIAQRVLDDVISGGTDPEKLEAYAASVENEEKPFKDNVNGVAETAEGRKASVASKAELQAAVKTLGMGPSAYKGLPKDDPEAYCKASCGELQRRVLAFVAKASGDEPAALPSAEELAEIKKAAEAKQELSSLDASNILVLLAAFAPAAAAGEAIKRDIQRDLEREAAQAASEPLRKKSKAETHGELAAAAAPSTKTSSRGSGSKGASNAAEKDTEEEEEEEEEEMQADSSDSDSSSVSDSSDDEDGEGEQEDEEEEA
ncbi:hypothetical protein Esti_001017 [Eimeria stiedai]